MIANVGEIEPKRTCEAVLDADCPSRDIGRAEILVYTEHSARRSRATTECLTGENLAVPVEARTGKEIDAGRDVPAARRNSGGPGWDRTDATGDAVLGGQLTEELRQERMIVNETGTGAD